jgi:ABC-type phosphate/phosphonate transport system substrate-binding protein
MSGREEVMTAVSSGDVAVAGIFDRARGRVDESTL